jgi:hypothetical protein
MLVSCLAYSSAQKIEEICSSETSVDFHRTTRPYVPEDVTLQFVRSLNHIVHNLKLGCGMVYRRVEK